MDKAIEFPGLTYTRPLGMPDPIPEPFMKSDDKIHILESIGEWLDAHVKHDDAYAVCMKPGFIIDQCVSMADMSAKQVKAMRKSLEKNGSPELNVIIEDTIKFTQYFFKREYPAYNIEVGTPNKTGGYMTLKITKKADDPWHKIENKIDTYFVVQIFDNTCEVIFLTMLRYFAYEPQLADNDEHPDIKLQRLVQTLMENRTLNRNQLTHLLLTSGYESSEIVALITGSLVKDNTR